MTAPFTCRTITDGLELADLAPDWWELWRLSPKTTPFQSPAWVLPWWKNLADGNACVLAVEHDRQLVGLAPLVYEQGPGGCCLQLMGSPVTDYQDFLLAPTLEEPILALLCSYLTDADFWDTLKFSELPPGGHAQQMAALPGCDIDMAYDSACPVLSLPDAPEPLESAFPPRKRRALRTAHNRAERRGSLQVRTADRESVLEAFEVLVALHRIRWDARGEPGVLADARVQQFHRDALPALIDAGLLRFYILQIGGRAAAAYYGLLDRDRAYGYLTGFDPAYAFESPSVLLLEHAIVEAKREGVREFHFLRGQEPYKYGWGACDGWNSCRVLRRNKACSHDAA